MKLEEAKKMEERGNPQAAMAAYQELIRSCAQEERWEELADALQALGRALDWHASDYPASQAAYEREIRVRQAHGLAGLDRARLGLAIVLHFQGHDQAALEQAQAVLSQSADPVLLGSACNLVGDVLLRSDPQRAAEHLRRSERLLVNIDQPYKLCHARLSLALLDACQGRCAAALEQAHAELATAEALGEPGVVGTAQLRLAEIRQLMGETELAQAHARQALEIGQEQGWAVMCEEALRLLRG